MENEKNHKVGGHYCLSRKFLEAAHSKCNLERQLPTKIPVFSHNPSRYDAHLLIRDLFKYGGEILKTTYLATMEENYINKEKCNGSKTKEKC